MRLRGGTRSCVVAGVHGAISAQRPRSSRKVRSPYRFSTNESSGGLYGLCSRAPGLVGKLPTPLKTTIPSHGGVLVLHGVGADRSKRHLSQTRMGTLKKYQSPPYVQERPLELLPFTPLSNPANAPGPSLRSAAGAKFWMRQNLRLGERAMVGCWVALLSSLVDPYLWIFSSRHRHDCFTNSCGNYMRFPF